MIMKVLVAIKLLFTYPKLCITGRGGFYLFPLERKLLDQLRHQLMPHQVEILLSQLNEINLIERDHLHRSIIMFYVVKNFEYSSERKNKFFSDKSEYVISRIDFRLLNSEYKYRAIFHVVNGNLFSIEFTANIENILRESEILITSLGFAPEQPGLSGSSPA